MPRTPPRSLRLRRSVWKTVSIYPRSAPVMTDLWFVLVQGEALRVKIFPIKGGVPLIPGLQEIKI